MRVTDVIGKIATCDFLTSTRLWRISACLLEFGVLIINHASNPSATKSQQNILILNLTYICSDTCILVFAMQQGMKKNREIRRENVDFKQFIILWNLIIQCDFSTDNMGFEPPWFLVTWLNRVGCYWTGCCY